MKIVKFTVILLAILLTACTGLPGLSGTPQPTPTVDRLAPPPMPAKPSQADLGAEVYYQVCMACHGDRGQGLTVEWREAWGEDSNCWQSECHGNDHPPDGFNIQKTCCKAVIGPTTLTRFQNGQELFDYVSKAMPWWKPGYLKTEEYWQVTNFLMRTNGAIPDGITLNPGNAFVFNLHPISALPGDSWPQAMLVSALLAGIAILLFLQNRRKGM